MRDLESQIASWRRAMRASGMKSTGTLDEHRFGDLSIWGISWSGGPLTATFLERFRAPNPKAVQSY